MGSLYFIFKNTVITIVIVCFLQLKFKEKTLENRLMSFLRLTATPKFLGTKSPYTTSQYLKITPQDLKEIRKKIYDSSILKNIKNSVKELFLNEMTKVIKEPENKKIKELKTLEK